MVYTYILYNIMYGRGGLVRSYCTNKTNAIVQIIIGNRLVIPYVRHNNICPVFSIIKIYIRTYHIFIYIFPFSLLSPRIIYDYIYIYIIHPAIGYYFNRRKYFRGNLVPSIVFLPTDRSLAGSIILYSIFT